MVDHLVFFTARDDASTTDLEDLVASLGALEDKIPGTVSISVGENFSPRSGGYTHGLCARFHDRDSLQEYLEHPEHLAVVEKLDRLTTGRIVVDYES